VSELDAVFKYPIAHRGLHDRQKGVIENSASAFARAISKGYAIECDLQLSGDEVPMVFHDSDLERLTRQKGAVAKLSAGQLGHIRLTASRKKDHPQVFSQLLEQVAGKVALVIELKNQNDGRNAELAQNAVQMARGYQGPLAFKSFSPHILHHVRAAGFNGPLGAVVSRLNASFLKAHNINLSAGQRFVMRHLLHYPKTRFDFVSAHHEALTLPAVRIFRRFGLPVMTWVVRSYEIELTTRGLADQLIFENYLPYRARN